MNLSTASEIHVHPNDTIQNAVNIAIPHDTIIIHSGTYTENVNVNKTLTIISYTGNPTDTIVQADDKNKSIFSVSAENVTIKGFCIKNVSGPNVHGICLFSSNNCTMQNNVVCYIEHGNGIHLAYSENNTLTNNTVNRNGLDGIRISNSKNNVLNNNVAWHNGWNGFFSELSVNNILNNNSASENGIAGIHSYRSERDTLFNNNISNNGAGIYIYNCQALTVSNNTVSDNEQGIYLHSCPKINIITSNKLLNNTNGISFVKASNCEISYNTVSSNRCGIFLTESSNKNKIYNNYFDNEINVLIDGKNNKNFWNTSKSLETNIIGGPYIGGNYWEQVNGKGLSLIHKNPDFEGISNSIYKINEENIDYLPLTKINKEFNPLLPVLMSIIIVTTSALFLINLFKKSH